MKTLMLAAALLVAAALPGHALALSADLVLKLGAGGGDERSEAVRALSATQDPAARTLIEALLAGTVQASASAQKVFVVADGKATDAATGEPVAAVPSDAEDVVVNNRLRRELQTGLAAFALAAPDAGERSRAIAALEQDPQAADDAVVAAAIARETDPGLRARLGLVQAAAALSGDRVKPGSAAAARSTNRRTAS